MHLRILQCSAQSFHFYCNILTVLPQHAESFPMAFSPWPLGPGPQQYLWPVSMQPLRSKHMIVWVASIILIDSRWHCKVSCQIQEFNYIRKPTLSGNLSELITFHDPKWGILTQRLRRQSYLEWTTMYKLPDLHGHHSSYRQLEFSFTTWNKNLAKFISTSLFKRLQVFEKNTDHLGCTIISIELLAFSTGRGDNINYIKACNGRLHIEKSNRSFWALLFGLDNPY